VFVLGFNDGLPAKTNSNGQALIEGAPRGNIMVHAQQLIGSPGELDEGDACYVPADLANPTSQDLRLVDCHDFTHFLDAVIYTEASIVLNPPKADFRKVTFTDEAIIEYTNCSADGCSLIQISGYDNHDPSCQVASISATCHLSPIGSNREGDVHIAGAQLCANGAGLDFRAHCTLLPDDRTVHVTGSMTLLVDDENTCGGVDEITHRDFDAMVPEDGGADLFQQTQLGHEAICFCPFPESCNDNATVTTSVFNKRDD
jgi:hypothetical protein